MRDYRYFILFLCSLIMITSPVAASQDQHNTSMPAIDTAHQVGDGILRRIYTPILMYHYISPLPPDADKYRVDLTVAPSTFHEHMKYLHDEGYTTISVYQLYDALIYGNPLPQKPIILTFDDGHHDHYTNVFPILKEFGFTGTFFIITQYVDNNLPQYMTWSQITEMASAGMHMEAHTKSHLDLRDRNYDFLIYEILGSIESLTFHTNRQSRIFAYPAGRYDSRTLEVLRTTPVLSAVTTQFGAYHTTSGRLELPRLRISNEIGVSGLAHILTASR